MRGDRFKKRLPSFVGKIPDLDDTFFAEDKEFERIDKRLKGFGYGLIASLLKGEDGVLDYLARFEKDYGLEGVGSIDDRISAILAKIGASRVTTEKALLDLCQSFGVEGEFYPDYEEYSFNLDLKKIKEKPNFDKLVKAINEIIPAHLDFILNLMLVDKLVFKESTKTYLNPFYMTGSNLYKTGQVYDYQHRGLKMVERVSLGDGGQVKATRYRQAGEGQAGKR
ncbi:hypothetical protein K8P03_10860 [Anaerococcus murdochii]|uniref:Uncharacterized protein n=1 Tax=Anaerococcus murdochii TaxID=411577 RepID=A0ABS7T1X8_9FIRM|nr:hypothetical protein [Anaerococcus murdochii]MBZ2387772.1 hypothetical protein [Anaerococcus murdochii]